MTAYGETALHRECAELTRLADGRHQRLCHSTFALGQLAGAGELDGGEAERALTAAAFACGYVKKRGEKAVRATIRTGLDRGMSKPRLVRRSLRRLPEKDAEDDWAAPEVHAPPQLDKRANITAAGPTAPPDRPAAERDKAQWLWRHRQPIASTIAEAYLREARGYGGSIQPTLGFLPARNGHPPALIAAFGMAT